MLEDIRPFDWLMLVVEILVLLLIGYEVGTTVWNKRVVRRRMAAAVLLMRRGEEIESAVPRSGNIDVATIPLWKESVNAWITETNNFLAGCSPQASAALLHNVGGGSIRYGAIAGDAHDYFVFLLARMNNLRAIMEKSDVYF